MDNNKGFTLIEILIVLTIVAAMATYGVQKIFRGGDDVKKVSRNISALSKEMRNRARLKNATLRLVFDMSNEPHRYWVEMTLGSKPIPENIYEPQEADEENPNPSGFQKDEGLLKKEKELPSDLFFGSVETINTKEPMTEGIAYIHFFPEGFVESSVVQLTNRKGMTFSLVFSPLTGRVDVIPEARSLKELSQ